MAPNLSSKTLFRRTGTQPELKYPIPRRAVSQRRAAAGNLPQTMVSQSKQGDLTELWLASLSPGLRLSAMLLSPSERTDAFAQYCELHEGMSARELAVRSYREHHPREILNDPDEALLYGVSEKTYRTMRQNGELK